MSMHRQIAQMMRAQAPSGPDVPAGSMAWTIETTAPNQLYTVGNGLGSRHPNYEIFWDDGTSNTVTSGYQNISHTYADVGTYQVYCVGDVPFVKPDGDGDPHLVSFDQFGDSILSLVDRMFTTQRSFKLIAGDVPNLSGVTSLRGMFYGTHEVFAADNGPYAFPGWDTAHISTWTNFAAYPEADITFDMSGVSFAAMNDGANFLAAGKFESSALYDKLLIQVDATLTQTGFSLNCQYSKYTSAASAARARIVDPGIHNVNLTDAGLEG